MFSFDKTDFQRVAVSGLGALTLTAASMFAAAAPVKAAPVTVPAWTAAVEDRITNVPMDGARSLAPTKQHRAEVALHFTSDGDFAGATLARSSGNPSIDASAVKVASRIRYPRLPESARGQARDVTMRLYFGGDDNAVAPELGAGLVQVAAR